MRLFTQLLTDLQARADEASRLAALKTYLAGAEPACAAWAIYLLAGVRPVRVQVSERPRLP